jgi:hypothetical protein
VTISPLSGTPAFANLSRSAVSPSSAFVESTSVEKNRFRAPGTWPARGWPALAPA